MYKKRLKSAKIMLFFKPQHYIPKWKIRQVTDWGYSVGNGIQN